MMAEQFPPGQAGANAASSNPSALLSGLASLYYHTPDARSHEHAHSSAPQLQVHPTSATTVAAAAAADTGEEQASVAPQTISRSNTFDDSLGSDFDDDVEDMGDNGSEDEWQPDASNGSADSDEGPDEDVVSVRQEAAGLGLPTYQQSLPATVQASVPPPPHPGPVPTSTLRQLSSVEKSQRSSLTEAEVDSIMKSRRQQRRRQKRVIEDDSDDSSANIPAEDSNNGSPTAFHAAHRRRSSLGDSEWVPGADEPGGAPSEDQDFIVDDDDDDSDEYVPGKPKRAARAKPKHQAAARARPRPQKRKRRESFVVDSDEASEEEFVPDPSDDDDDAHELDDAVGSGGGNVSVEDPIISGDAELSTEQALALGLRRSGRSRRSPAAPSVFTAVPGHGSKPQISLSDLGMPGSASPATSSLSLGEDSDSAYNWPPPAHAGLASDSGVTTAASAAAFAKPAPVADINPEDLPEDQSVFDPSPSPVLPQEEPLNCPILAEFGSFQLNFGIDLGLPWLSLRTLRDLILQQVPPEGDFLKVIKRLLRRANRSTTNHRLSRHIASAARLTDPLLADLVLRFGFYRLRPCWKLRALLHLCNAQFDYNPKLQNIVKETPAQALRPSPTGYDRFGAAYWYLPEPGGTSGMVFQQPLDSNIQRESLEDEQQQQCPQQPAEHSADSSDTLPPPAKRRKKSKLTLNRKSTSARGSKVPTKSKAKSQAHPAEPVERDEVALLAPCCRTALKWYNLGASCDDDGIEILKQQQKERVASSLTSHVSTASPGGAGADDDVDDDDKPSFFSRRWRCFCHSLEDIDDLVGLLKSDIDATPTLIADRDGCAGCHGNEDEELFLYCDGCERGYHTYCSVPPLKVVPEGDYFCPFCTQQKLIDTLSDIATSLHAEARRAERSERRVKELRQAGVDALKSMSGRHRDEHDDVSFGGDVDTSSLQLGTRRKARIDYSKFLGDEGDDDDLL